MTLTENNSTTYNYFSIGSADDIPAGERVLLEINRIPIVVFNVDGKFFALKDVCTHDEGPLGDGDLEGYEIVCPRHAARFDIRDGRVTMPPAFVDDQVFPVLVEDGQLKIGIPF
ncbi:MAG: non-heme iron oxygenase ferredoxin subunit [Anaerolineae bacterium]|nr:non-heme iron oxygenase ferredoxin subunit [Anaerolineae bacterium]